MSSKPVPPPEHELPGHTARRSWSARLRDVPVRTKLALILVIPVVAALVLTTGRLVEVGGNTGQASLVRALTALCADVSAVAEELHRERMAAATFLTVPQSDLDPYDVQVRRSDERIAAFQTARNRIDEVPAVVEAELNAIDRRLSTLRTLRQEVLDRRQMPATEVLLRYGVILTDLVAYPDAVARFADGSTVASRLRAVAWFARARAAVAEEQAAGFAALSTGRLTTEQYAAFLAPRISSQEALAAFHRAATLPEQELVTRTVTGEVVARAEQIAAVAASSVGQRAPVSATAASDAIGALHELMRAAEVQLESQLVAAAEQARLDALWRLTVEALVALVVLVVVIVLLALLIRSFTDSLRGLRVAAQRIVDRDLPDVLSRLRTADELGEGGIEKIMRQIRAPIPLTSRDEVGQVAATLNAVHREAVRIAAERATLWADVSAMFLNLARRSQALVDRMVSELDQIRHADSGPARSAHLAELDRLAARMRRRDENLLVLVGADSAAPRRDDLLLVDALRMAQSEVEPHHRIDFGTVDTDTAVAAHAANDVVRLVAELMDNATRFSPPETYVIADARRIRDYVLIQIEDRGLGLSDEQLDDLNARLGEPAEVDVSVFRLMGLAVVSRLAARHGIRVELRRSIEGGTVAQVTLPSSMVVLVRTRSREQALSRLRPPLAVEAGPAAAIPGPLPAALPAASIVSAPTTPAVSIPALPTGPVAGVTFATTPRSEQVRETPIFRETEVSWFHAHGQESTTIFEALDEGSTAVSVGAEGNPAPSDPVTVVRDSTVRVMGVARVPTPPPYQPTDPAVPVTDVGWRTAADEGWLRASQAAEPTIGGMTASGLPRRVPQAQLVPGGVATGSDAHRTRRTPDEVRGMLSAYHRGVQRGRLAGDVQNGTTSIKETSG